MSKKHQARDDTNRNHKITVRFSEDEYDQINFICEVLGITYSQYLRRAALTRRIEHPTIYATFSDNAAQQLTGQMGKIGSNLNQIAHHYNGGGVRSREMYERTQRAISELYAMKYEVEKMGGEFRGYSEAYRRKKQ